MYKIKFTNRNEVVEIEREKFVKTFHYHYWPCMTSLLSNISLSVHALRIANINVPICVEKIIQKEGICLFDSFASPKAPDCNYKRAVNLHLEQWKIKNGENSIKQVDVACMLSWRRKFNVNYPHCQSFFMMRKIDEKLLKDVNADKVSTRSRCV